MRKTGFWLTALLGSAAFVFSTGQVGPGGSNIGEFDLSNIPTIQAAGYAQGQALGALQTFPNVFRQPGSTGIMNNQGVTSKGGITTSVALYVFKANPTASTCNDKSAFVLGVADIPKLIATIPTVLSPAVVGPLATPTTAYFQQPISMQNTENSTNLYLCAVAGAAVTPLSTTDLQFNLAGLKD